MEREKKIVKNTVLFALGDICTKVLSFIIAPMFTFLLTTSEFGIIDLIISSSSVVMSILSLSILNGVFRFTIGNVFDKKGVFTIGILITIIASCIVFLTFSILYYFNIPFVRQYGLMVSLYLIFNMIHPVMQYFIKGIEKIKVYVFNSILYSATSLSFCLLFVVNYKMGVNGYLLGFIVGAATCCLYMTIRCKLYKYFSFKSINKNLLCKMLSYCIPLIFNNIAWWIMALSDKYVFSGYIGVAANGILSIAHKIPSIITMIYGMFAQAFILSAISDYDLIKDKKFFQTMFNNIFFILITCASIIIVIIEPLTRCFIGIEFYESWKYVPLMLLGAVFDSLLSYCGIVYNIKMENFKFAVSAVIGGITNFIVCILLINHIGLYAASVSTVVAYFVIFIIRWLDIRKYIFLPIDKRNIISFLLIITQILICIFVPEVLYILIANSCITGLILVVNIPKEKKIFLLIKTVILSRRKQN